MIEIQIGDVFGRLTVIASLGSRKFGNNKLRFYLCECVCGKSKEVPAIRLLSKITRSCGCLRIETTVSRFTTHNLHNHLLYSKWGGMISRCENTKGEFYKDYGERGIVVCEQWRKDFKTFYDWSILNGWRKGLSIDRINVNGNYEPSNCRWITMKEQSRNRRNSRYISYKGISLLVSEWADELKMKRPGFFQQINKGKSIEAILKKRGKTYGIQFSFGYIG